MRIRGGILENKGHSENFRDFTRKTHREPPFSILPVSLHFGMIAEMINPILHVDMDAFFASVEQRDHPEWRGKPLIVGAPPDARGVVSTCSYEARTFGVRSAMPSREAFRRCPHGIFVQPNMKRYHAVSEAVFEIFHRFTPLVESVSVDEAFLDVSGAKILFGPPESIAQQIRQAIRDELHLTASVGVAPNKFLAKLASEVHKPDGMFVVPQDLTTQLHWLGELPVQAVWGIGKKSAEILHRHGFRFVRDLQQADPSRLRLILGANAAEKLMELAFGRDNRPITISREEKSISHEYTFPADCSDRSTVREILKKLCEAVGTRLRDQNLFATVAKMKLRWKDFTTLSRQRPLPSPICDDFALREAAFKLFDAEPFLHPVRLIGFGVTGLTDTRQQQQPLLFPEFGENTDRQEKREKLCMVWDRLRRDFKPNRKQTQETKTPPLRNNEESTKE